MVAVGVRMSPERRQVSRAGVEGYDSANWVVVARSDHRGSRVVGIIAGGLSVVAEARAKPAAFGGGGGAMV